MQERIGLAHQAAIHCRINPLHAGKLKDECHLLIGHDISKLVDTEQSFMNKAAFLDRDGVINQKAATEDEYVTRWEEMAILPGVADAIRQLNRVGFKVIVVTNQRCVSKGFITTQELELIHQQMCDHFSAAGATIDAIYYCPHELEPPCACRKPEPGMLLEAAREHDIDLQRSWMIGDSDKDVEAGRRAGCFTARLLSGNRPSRSHPDVIAPSLLAAVPKILTFEAPASGDRIRGE